MKRCEADAVVARHLPLKPLVFHVLLALTEGERHGWALVRDAQQRGGFARLMPGNFYRTLRSMLADGLIEEAVKRPRAAAGEPEDERRRYFRLTALGGEAVAAEARRLEALLIEARAKRLLARSRT